MADELPAEGDKRGRRPKITDEIIQAVAGAVLDGSFRVVAAKRFGISPTTLKRWMRAGKRFPTGQYGLFRSLVLEAEAAAEQIAVAAVIAAGKTQDAKHLEWWLERKFPQRWGRYRGELADLKREMKALRETLGADADGTTAGGTGDAAGESG